MSTQYADHYKSLTICSDFVILRKHISNGLFSNQKKPIKRLESDYKKATDYQTEICSFGTLDKGELVLYTFSPVWSSRFLKLFINPLLPSLAEVPVRVELGGFPAQLSHLDFIS